MTYDLIVVGAGTAGLPCAAFAAGRGLSVLLVDAADRIGGTLHYSGAHMSAGGTRMQARRGIADSPAEHLADAIRISRGTLDEPLARKAIELAPGVADWLEEIGLRFPEDMPRVVPNHEPDRTARTFWPEGGGPALLAALAPLLDAPEVRRHLTLALGTRLVALLPDGADGVAGVRLRWEGGDYDAEGRHVVLTTGGYGGNAALFRRFHGQVLRSACWEANDGGGITAAEAIGAAVERAETFLPSFGGIHDHTLDPPRYAAIGHTIPQLRPPGEIWVDTSGRRFVAEDEPSVDARERALLRLPAMTFWAVFDDATRREAPLFPHWPPGRFERFVAENATFRSSPTIAGLAEACGLPGDALSATVTATNAATAAGNDPMGRRVPPRPITTPPYFAVAHFGIALKTYAGLGVDESLRVRRALGATFPNLHAAGEVLGGGRLSGNAFVGGMSVTPALAFGRWLGRTIG